MNKHEPLDIDPKGESKTQGQRMAEVLENLANESRLEHLDPMVWQRETREDRPLPGRGCPDPPAPFSHRRRGLKSLSRGRGI